MSDERTDWAPLAVTAAAFAVDAVLAFVGRRKITQAAPVAVARAAARYGVSEWSRAGHWRTLASGARVWVRATTAHRLAGRG